MVQDTKEQNSDQKRYVGEIISYLPEKHYGFIRSDDGKELFFLDSGVKYAKDLQALKEKVAVSFFMQPTNKSFKALEVEILKLKDGEERYEVPLEVMIYQEEVDGRYKLLKDSYKYVIDYRGTSINEVVYKAQSWATHFGCNALHHARLIRRTAQELTPSGMRYYTEFRYIGSPCFVGAKSVKGTVTKKDIPQDLDKKLQDYYENYQDEALDTYEKALKLSPDSAMAYFNIGSVYQIKQDHKKACEYLQMPKATFYYKVGRGEIPCIKQGKRYYIYQDELDKWLESARKIAVPQTFEEQNEAILSGHRRKPNPKSW